jgi:PrtD family type I secretion system ABC transporter
MRELLRRCRFFFLYAGLFSFFVNLLLLVSPLYIMQLFDRVLGSRSTETLLMLTGAAIGALSIMALLEALRSRLLVRAGIALDQLIAQPVLATVLRTTARPAGSAHPYAMRDVSTVRSFLGGHGVLAFFDAPWSPVFVAIIFILHPLLGVIATIGIVLLFSLAILEEKVTSRALNEARARGRRAGGFTDQSTRNAEVVYALGMIPAVTERWSALNNQALEQQTIASNRAGKILAATKFTRYALQIVMLATGAFLVIDLHLTPGIMIGATLILGRALAPVEMAISGWKAMVEARGSYGRLKAMMEAEAAREPPMPLPAPEGHLAVEKVVFARTIANPVLKGVSFELAVGESLGLIGPSAAGKSTLARVIMGIWPPVSGAVRLDGADIADWDREQLGQHVGYLPQDTELFSGTVAENIARLRDPMDCKDEVIAAARKAMVHEMILRLPEGYDTNIGNEGTVLSGGQRQRIALARALFGSPRLVVLDEPNSNLDSDGELALMQCMQRLKEERVTLIVITHRPSILANIDKILLLREGRVEMFGPRQETMARLARGGVVPHAQPPRPQVIG